MDTTTVIAYFDILEDTLLGFRLHAFHESLRKRQSLKPKFYFFDLGIKRALEHTLTVPLLPQTFAFGNAFEHFIIAELIRINAYYVKDWSFSFLRTKDDVEIDLIIERPGKIKVFIEIKSSENVSQEDCRNLSAFAKETKGKFLLLSRDPHPKEFGSVHCLPWKEAIQVILQE